jgi:23S rRNA (pseudouridine1915-N3)-methyltransferase
MIKVIAGGKKNRGWVAEAVAEYEKRLSKYWQLEWRFVEDEKVDEAAASCKQEDFVIVLDERGENISSPELSKMLAREVAVARQIVLVIGGAYGVAEETRARADLVWSLSKLVFPHEVVRLLVAEQVYRAESISLGRAYHHE